MDLLCLRGVALTGVRKGNNGCNNGCAASSAWIWGRQHASSWRRRRCYATGGACRLHAQPSQLLRVSRVRCCLHQSQNLAFSWVLRAGLPRCRTAAGDRHPWDTPQVPHAPREKNTHFIGNTSCSSGSQAKPADERESRYCSSPDAGWNAVGLRGWCDGALHQSIILKFLSVQCGIYSS